MSNLRTLTAAALIALAASASPLAAAGLDEGKFGRNLDDGKYGQSIDEGKFGAATFDGR